MECPACQSENIVKNGHIHNGKQKFSCKDCGRQFVEHPENRTVSDETKNFVDRLLREKISLAGIARVTGVSEKWLQDYVNRKYADVPREISVTEKKEDGLPWSVMKYGLLSAVKTIRYGFGSQRTRRQLYSWETDVNSRAGFFFVRKLCHSFSKI